MSFEGVYAIMDCEKFAPVKRTALDGRVWRVVFDMQTRRYSPLLCFGKYRTRGDCLYAISAAARMGFV